MSLAGLLVDKSAVTTEFIGLTAVALIRRHEPDGTVAVPVVVPVHECTGPAAGLFLAAEGPPGVIRPVLDRAEQRLRVGVVVAHPRPGEGSEDSQLLQTALECGGSHGVSVVGMEDQRPGPAFADPLPQARATDQISGDLCLFPLGHVPGHHLAAPDIDHQIEVEPDATDAGGQIGDVPAPHLVRAIRPEARHCPRCLRWSCPTPPLALPSLVQDPINTGLRADVVALIGQCWHDLPRWQRGVFRLIAGEQDSLTFLFA